MASAPFRTILFHGAPHPLTDAIFEYLRAILAIDATISCELVTGAPRPAAPHESAIYIRAEATDAAPLAAMANLTGPPGVRRACALLTALDACWRHLPRLSVEATLNQELYATWFLAEHGVLPIDHRALAAAREGWRTLRNHASATDNPLGYFASVDLGAATTGLAASPEADPADAGAFTASGFVQLAGEAPVEGSPSSAGARFVAELMASHAARNILVLSCDASAALAELGPHLPRGALIAAATIDGTNAASPMSGPYIQADYTGRADWPAPAGLDLVHLHHVERSTRLADILPWARARLSPRGVISGAERSAEALSTVVSALARDSRGDEMAFALHRLCWKAVPHGYWSA